MTRVLLTCPPMIGIVDEMRPVFAERGAEIVVPDFVQIVPEAELMTMVPEYDAWIIGDDPATAAVLQAGCAGALKACVKWGVGVDNVDFAAAKALKLPISNTPGVFGDEVADVAMHYVTGLARETFVIDRGVRDGGWPKPRGISLRGRTAVLVGFGDIGRETAVRMIAAGLTVKVVDPYFANTIELPVEEAPWPDALANADFVVFTCPLTDDTRHMLNASTLAQAPTGLRVVNVSRGPVIDEGALIDALASGQVHSAALDVFEVEPLPANSPLRDHPHCVFGSHNGSNTADAVRRVSLRAAELLFAGLDEARGR
ncbi:MAG: NAD(P)-dependent oxidoreductase [Pseudomonadota bacterium]